MAKNSVSQKQPAKCRKSLPKRLRFEVFKRDSFKCQYCGASAPDVLLHVDHIHPLAGGGEPNDITNLITACDTCNLGKGARVLSDGAVAAKRKAQLDQLQERREQLEMMSEWQRGLIDLDEQAAMACADLWKQVCPGYSLSDTGMAMVRDWVRKFGVSLVMESMRSSAHYLKSGEYGRPTAESAAIALSKVPAICTVKRREKDNPGLGELYKIRGTLRYRISGYFCDWKAIDWLKAVASWGLTPDEIRQGLSGVSRWTEFSDAIDDLISEGKRRQGEVD
jgi:hypothetical protein